MGWWEMARAHHVDHDPPQKVFHKCGPPQWHGSPLGLGFSELHFAAKNDSKDSNFVGVEVDTATGYDCNPEQLRKRQGTENVRPDPKQIGAARLMYSCQWPQSRWFSAVGEVRRDRWNLFTSLLFVGILTDVDMHGRHEFEYGHPTSTRCRQVLQCTSVFLRLELLPVISPSKNLGSCLETVPFWLMTVQWRIPLDVTTGPHPNSGCPGP